MKIYSKNEAKSLLNYLSSERIPFLLLTDFLGEKSIIRPLNEIDSYNLKFDINGKSNYEEVEILNDFQIDFEKFPLPFHLYQKAFNLVKKNILLGNSFLTNLTCETPIDLNISLENVFKISEAKYKIWLKENEFFNEFVCFSPEIFVKIDKHGNISSFPMKGTIDANLLNAEEILLNDKKEYYEHTTIVDLIRNDLSKVAEKVWVEKFRYLDKVKKQDESELLQVSSQISGLLARDWKEKLGEIIYELLPAGSISGAPKDKTIELINEAEKLTYFQTQNRGFYTGICGVFDGETFDSGVMIRFIEQTDEDKVFKSGGGITSNSIAENEFQEMIQKIYVPIIRNNKMSKSATSQPVLSQS